MPVDLTHPCVKVPDHKATIWRYMQFPKFASLLLSKALFFTGCDQFKDDPWEGRYPPASFDKNTHVAGLISCGMSQVDAERTADSVLGHGPLMEEMRSQFAISCWHLNNSESDAFWRIYSRMDEGIAIRSTVGNLVQALSAQDRRNIHISAITYENYKTSVIPLGNIFYPIIHKRDSFKHEHELRAFFWNQEGKPPTVTAKPFLTPAGELVPVDLERLVLEVVVSPLAPSWFVADVRSLLARLGYDFPCSQSDLLKIPV